MNRKIKLPLFIVAGILAIYSVIWFKITSDISESINQKLSDQMLNVTQSHRVRFDKAVISGFPFSFGVKLHNVIEDTSKALIKHKDPVFIGYNIFTQELFTYYNGESAIETKPTKDQKHLISSGEFRHSVYMPISVSDIRKNIKNPNNLDILSNLQSVSLRTHNANLRDITDNQNIVDNANIDITLSAKHTKKYENLNELMKNIPQDYEIAVKIANQCPLDQQRSISTSVVYGVYIPFNLQYNLNTTLHTGAKTFATADLLSDIQIKNWESFTSNTFEEASSKISSGANISTNDIKFDFNSASTIKSKAKYNKKLDESLKTLLSILPDTLLGSTKSMIRQLDFSALDLDTKDDPVSINLKLNLHLKEKPTELHLDIPNFGISFHDVGFDIKNSTNAHLDTASPTSWTSGGVLSIQQYPLLVKYLTNSYFTLFHLPENAELNSTFYMSVLTDFMRKLANSVNDTNSTMTVDYSLESPELTKSKIGKFTLAEATIL